MKARGHLIAAHQRQPAAVTFLNDKNELTGYHIEVGRFIASHLGVKLDLVWLDWKGILPGLQTGRFDVVFSNVNTTPDRKETFDYAIPYSRSAVVVVAKSNPTPRPPTSSRTSPARRVSPRRSARGRGRGVAGAG
jgi:ABC-type amino acid transport substrate-binding protein